MAFGSGHKRRLVYAAARDVTEQKQALQLLNQANERQEEMQRQLIFADRMASVGTLAAGVAHEINNPLASVTANISMILRDLDDDNATLSSGRLEELREMAGDVQVAANRIREIVRGLKTFSGAEAERRTAIDLRLLLELVLNMTFGEIRHRGRLVKDFGPVPLVDADEPRLGQVFINLFINAAQALPSHDSGHSEIRVSTSTDAAGRAVVEFRDTGQGIPQRIMARIFDPFFTTKPIGTGTGLGLSFCHNIIAGLGGEITVTSKEGDGATFRVMLPAAPSRPRPPPKWTEPGL